MTSAEIIFQHMGNWPGRLDWPCAQGLWKILTGLSEGAKVLELGSGYGRLTILAGAALKEIGGTLYCVEQNLPEAQRWLGRAVVLARLADMVAHRENGGPEALDAIILSDQIAQNDPAPWLGKLKPEGAVVDLRGRLAKDERFEIRFNAGPVACYRRKDEAAGI